MKKTAFHSIMALAVVLGLTLSMATPVVADSVGVEKGTIPGAGHPADVYLVYQDVSYNLTLINNTGDDGEIRLIRDRFALGTGAVEDAWWDDGIKDWVDEDPGFSFAFPAGAAWVEEVTHTLRPEHLIDHPSIDDAKGVTNQLRYEAEIGGLPSDHNFPKTVLVIRPAIELEKDVEPKVASVGDVVEYTFTIRNNGDWPLKDIVLVDPLLGLSYVVPAVLDSGDDYVVGPIPYTIQAGDLPLVNTATVEGTADDFDAGIFPYADPDHEIPTAVVRDTASATVRSELPPVGGTGYPISSLALLAPWIVLAGVIVAAAVFVWSRRAQGRA